MLSVSGDLEELARWAESQGENEKAHRLRNAAEYVRNMEIRLSEIEE